MQNKYFNAKWLANFGKSLTEAQKCQAGIGRDGFLWHSFSYEYVPCLKGDDARETYEKIDKCGATQAFYEMDDTIVGEMAFVICNEVPITDDYLTAKQIDESEKIEVYIIGKNNEWCYIRTHEDICGPYFCFANKR